MQIIVIGAGLTASDPPCLARGSLPTWLKLAGIGLLAMLLGGCFGTPVTPALAPHSSPMPILQSTATRLPEPATNTPELPVILPDSVNTISPGCVVASATLTRSRDEMTMMCVPGGTFQMGSESGYPCAGVERPVHPVTLRTFWIDQTEVTNAQYTRCVTSGMCKVSIYANDAAYNGSQQPVVGVDWDNALAYCQWVGAHLPSEAQWEYAARGVEGYIYPWGNSLDETQYNHCDKSCPVNMAGIGLDDGYAYTAPVGSFPGGKSWVGALDLAGNVWEWTTDWYGPYAFKSPTNPEGPATGDYRVARGGSWRPGSCHGRSACRGLFTPTYTADDVGFRCVVVDIQE